MAKKILLLGHTGKMGTALKEVFEDGYTIIGKNSADFDALDFDQVKDLIDKTSPDIVMNTVAMLGIDSCEKDPEKAHRLNALYPKFLAELSNNNNFLLVHFSTDAVFNDEKQDFYTERDFTSPLNVYGSTKYRGDCFVQDAAKQYFLFRISVIFGEASKHNQFVEKMLLKVKEGKKPLKISDDIVLSPTYSRDAAREIRRILEEPLPFGLYHIANEGKASLYDLMNEIIKNLSLDATIEKASYKDFPYIGRKNTYTPLKSDKIRPLRHWKEAVKEYCVNHG